LCITLIVCPQTLNGSGETAAERERCGERGRGADGRNGSARETGVEREDVSEDRVSYHCHWI